MRYKDCILGNTALYRAAYCGHAEVITQLLTAGTNIDLQDKVSIITVFILIVCK